MSERAEQSFDDTSLADDEGDTTGWLSTVNAPVPKESPYFKRGGPGRRFGRGMKRKRYAAGGGRRAKQARTSSPGKNYRGTGSRGRASYTRSRSRGRGMAKSSQREGAGFSAQPAYSTARGSSSSSGLGLLSLPTPRSFLPKPKVVKF